jgi:RNA-directed DNA polymerase
MTAVVTRTGALSHATGRMAHHRLVSAHRTVRRLQARIVKAVQAGRWGKVRALQHLLTLLVQRQSSGCQTGDG